MTPLFSSVTRLGLVALGVLVGLCAPAMAGPVNIPAPVIQTDSFARQSTQVSDDSCNPNGGRCFRNSSRNWNGDSLRRPHWNDDDYRWRNRRHVRRHHNYRPYRHYRQPQIYLDFYVPSYRYVQPRRHHRVNRFGSAHVDWCYNRWLSYRAYDNTYQPLHGRRRQCWSPYS